jgi:putative transposase
MRYAFMATHQGQWPIPVLGEVLAVSRSGFYASVQRQKCGAVPGGDMAVLARVKTIAAASGYSYGSRRMAKALQDEGYEVGRYQARRLMRQASVAVRQTKRCMVTTNSRHRFAIAPNLLARQFDVEAPNRAWASDLTYLWTGEGWLSVAVTLDLYSRKVVGWAMSDRMDATVVQHALEMALGRRQPHKGLIHHSDRGVQYACQAFQGLLAEHGIRCSMSRKGDCLDNAVAERFFGSLKRERTHHRQYMTRQEARADVVDYVEMFYNSWRKHSYLGYVSPNEYETFGQGA